MFSAFVFIACLSVLLQILTDRSRDSELGGVIKAVWLIVLIALLFLTAMVYVIVRGSGMARRQQAAFQRSQGEAESYVRLVPGKSPVDQIGAAKRPLDAGEVLESGGTDSVCRRVRPAEGDGADLVRRAVLPAVQAI